MNSWPGKASGSDGGPVGWIGGWPVVGTVSWAIRWTTRCDGGCTEQNSEQRLAAASLVVQKRTRFGKILEIITHNKIGRFM